MYGLTALRITKTKDEETTSAVKHILSDKDRTLTILAVVIGILGGLVGIILFFLSISIVKLNSKNYDIKVAFYSILIWLIALFLFFVVLWPSL